jgi:hypothetical protein
MNRRSSTLAATLCGALLLALCTSCAGASAAFTATTANGGSSIVAASDWVAPQTTMLDPGTPLHATVTLTATAVDPGGTMASVSIQRSPAGAGAWSTVCTAASAPYSCPLETTTLADGAYDLRAVARDTAANSATSNTVSSRVVDNTGPSVALNPIATDVRGALALGAVAADGGSGVAAVRIERSLAGQNAWTAVCTDTSSPYGCSLDTTALANDIYDFRAVAQDVLGNSTVSALLTGVQVDNAVPIGVAVTAPASPLRGAVTLTATADDLDSGIATVTLQRSSSGAGVFTTVCATSSYPYSCTLVTTAGATPDGSYDLRAVAVDYAGNSTTSAIVTRTVDNTQASVSLVDPGAFLRATVTVQANAFSGTGVTQVVIQRSPATKNTYTAICTDASSPYSCSFDTTTVADGLYDLRAVMTYGTGQTLTSAVVVDRRVDNLVVTGYDVQTENRAGGSAGRVEAGDVLVLTWSGRMNTATLLSGWDGTGTANATVRLSDGANASINTGGGADALELLDVAGNATGLGSVNLKANMVRAKKTVVFAATATQSTVTVGAIDRTVVRLTLGAVTTGATNIRTASGTPAMAWAPSASARDLFGNVCSVAPISELGSLDRDF